MSYSYQQLSEIKVIHHYMSINPDLANDGLSSTALDEISPDRLKDLFEKGFIWMLRCDGEDLIKLSDKSYKLLAEESLRH